MMDLLIPPENGAPDLSEKLLSGGDSGDAIIDPSDLHQQHQHTEDVVMDEELHNSGTSSGGEKQPPQFRDAWAAVLFLSHLTAITYLSIAWGVPALDFEYTSFGTTDQVHFAGIFYLSLLSSCAALGIAAAALAVLTRFAETLVQISLLGSLVCNAVLVMVFLSQRFWWGAAGAAVGCLWGAWYAKVVWRRIPFAAANLKTALTAVQSNAAVFVVAVVMVVIVNVFTVLWMLAWLGVAARSATCEHGECASHMSTTVVVLFLTSYYWSTSVGKNVLHSTVSGVVGTWWFAPEEASSFCSNAVTDSWVRSSTYSLGSICLGSLLTAVLQVAYHLVNNARRQSRGNDLLLCVVECLVGFLERIVAYFNKWAYVYIGLYGYDYVTAGKKVMDLFMERGWTAIINDDLVSGVCGLVSLAIGLVTGCIGILLGQLNSSWVEELGSSAAAVSFLMPFLIGTAVAYILMSVVASAVDTVIVTFAEAPLDFERNHPGLHQQMVSAWGLVYPAEFAARS